MYLLIIRNGNHVLNIDIIFLQVVDIRQSKHLKFIIGKYIMYSTDTSVNRF